MDLFDNQDNSKDHQPLAEKMRPKTIEDIVGQEHLLGEGKVLRTLIEHDKLTSIIFWGPPGVGKTTIASAIAQTTKAKFVPISAVTTGIKEAREIIKRAHDDIKFHNKKTILFIDEIHRFNKAQQDAFLPSVENGTITLIGATTENPSFEVNSALLSRSQVFVLNAHTAESLAQILERAIETFEEKIQINAEAQSYLINHANGDARTLLNTLDLCVVLASNKKKIKNISLETVEEAVQHKALQYDKNGEEHYNVISAFIKSMRNSDANAALYWLARMLEAGEDARFIARRMVVFASEDVGNADFRALLIANAVAQAVEFVGLPEARINLAQAVVYLAEAKKSNRSYMGLKHAEADVKTHGNLPVPKHLRNAPTKLMKDLDYGKGYQYAHDHKNAETDMQCLPDKLKDVEYLD